MEHIRGPRNLPSHRAGRQATVERRSGPRHAASISTEVVEPASATRLVGRATDMGLHGCYIDTINPFPVGTNVQIQMSSGGRSFQCRARVVYSTTGMGMGLAFTEIPADQAPALQAWVNDLAGGASAPHSADATPFDTSVFRTPVAPPSAPTPAEEVSAVHATVAELLKILTRKNILSESEADDLNTRLTR